MNFLRPCGRASCSFGKPACTATRGFGCYGTKSKPSSRRRAGSLPTKEPNRRPGELLPGGIKDVETLIKEGHDPIHAAYIYMQNFTSRFAEGVSQFPEMRAWADVVAKAEDEYMPSGLPMSPLTGSYFWVWAIYDLRIGKSTDTVAYCQIAMNDVLQMNSHQLDAAKKLEASRMGIYEHVGTEGPHLLLRELITDDQFLVHCPTGYGIGPMEGVGTQRYKLIHYFYADQAWELYDLQNDPAEMHNLYGDAERADLVKRLKTQLVQLRTQYRFNPTD